MTDFVQPVTLPAQMELTPEGTDCIVTGWGTLHVSRLVNIIVYKKQNKLSFL